MLILLQEVEQLLGNNLITKVYKAKLQKGLLTSTKKISFQEIIRDFKQELLLLDQLKMARRNKKSKITTWSHLTVSSILKIKSLNRMELALNVIRRGKSLVQPKLPLEMVLLNSNHKRWF